MTDAKIPEVCKNCKHCERYYEIGHLMYDWVPWEHRCKIGKEAYQCEQNGGAPKDEAPAKGTITKGQPWWYDAALTQDLQQH